MDAFLDLVDADYGELLEGAEGEGGGERGLVVFAEDVAGEHVLERD